MTYPRSISTISDMVFEDKTKGAQAWKNLMTSGKAMLPLMGVMVLLSGFRSATFSFDHLQSGGPPIANTLLIAWLSGSILGPLLLPWLPGRSLSLKGLMTGLLGLLLYPASCFFLHLEPLDVLMALLVIPSVTSFLMLYFTSPPPRIPLRRLHNLGGRRGLLTDDNKHPIAIPIQWALMALAAGIWIAARFI